MKSNSRDNFKLTIIKFFLLALVAMFFLIGCLNSIVTHFKHSRDTTTTGRAVAVVERGGHIS